MFWQKPNGWETYMGKRLLALVLDVQKLRNFPITVKGQSNSRCLVDVYASTCGVRLYV